MHHWEPEEVGGWWARVEEAEPIEDVLEAVRVGIGVRDEETVTGMVVLEAAWRLVAARYSAGWITMKYQSGVLSLTVID